MKGDSTICSQGAGEGLNGVNCKGHEYDVGVDVRYRLQPASAVDPWFRLGFGYEWATAGSVDPAPTFAGFQLLSAQFGVDFHGESNVGVGPFLGFSVGKYTDVEGSGTSSPFGNKTFHEWLTLGVRAAYDFRS
jgi:hypothetical protein